MNFGEKDTLRGEAVFQFLVLHLVKYFGATWSEMQIMECGKVCFLEWYFLTFAELKHFSHKAKAGGFKEKEKSSIYGQFSPAVMVDWLSMYATETHEERGAYFGKSRLSNWTPPENPVDPERIKQLVSELESELAIQAADEEIAAQKRRQAASEANRIRLENLARHESNNPKIQQHETTSN